MSSCAARLHVCVLRSEKDKGSSGKMAETPATAAAVCAAYEQRCPADCGTERERDGRESGEHCGSAAELPVSVLAELAFPYISCIRLSISEQTVSTISV